MAKGESKKNEGKARATDAPKLAAQVNEVKNLTIGYARQEVLGPLKTLGRYLGFGVSGAIAIGIGSIIVLIGVLRLLQTQTGTTFRGNWNFAPYLLTVVAGFIVIALCVKGIMGRSTKGK